MRPIILASASPRRKTLLAQIIGDRFTVEESDFDEETLGGTCLEGKAEEDVDGGGERERDRSGCNEDPDPINHVLASSQGKACSVASRHSKGVVIGADTIVVCNGTIIGKPHTPDRAIEMLREISGKTVDVITGITVIDIKGGRELQAHEVTKVFIRDLDERMIQNYVATGEPLDKAGAFGIQGKGAVLVERIEGDYFNVVGLPLFSLAGLLRQVGVDVLSLD